MSGQLFFNSSFQMEGKSVAVEDSFGDQNSATLPSQQRIFDCRDQNMRMTSDGAGQPSVYPQQTLFSPFPGSQPQHLRAAIESLPEEASQHSGTTSSTTFPSNCALSMGGHADLPLGSDRRLPVGSSANGMGTLSPSRQPPNTGQGPFLAHQVLQNTSSVNFNGPGNESISIPSEVVRTCPSSWFPFHSGDPAISAQLSSYQKSQVLPHFPATSSHLQQHHDPLRGNGAPSFSTMASTERIGLNDSSNSSNRNNLYSQMAPSAPLPHFSSYEGPYFGKKDSTGVPSPDSQVPHQNIQPSSVSVFPPASSAPHALLSVPSPMPPVVGNGAYSHDTLSAALSADAFQSAQELARKKQEEDDKAQLEKIIRLRRELELEEERDREKEREKETWACDTCTFRNPLSSTSCEMCQSPNPRLAASLKSTSVSTIRTDTENSSRVHECNDVWDCRQCHVRNSGSGTHCAVCSAPRSMADQSQVKANAPKTTTNSSFSASHQPSSSSIYWRCSVCSEVNSPRRSNCKICNGYQRNGIPVDKPFSLPHSDSHLPGSTGTNTTTSEEVLPTVWSCSVCTFDNSVRNPICSACASGQRPRHLAPPEKRKEKDLATKGFHKEFTGSRNRIEATANSSAGYPRSFLSTSNHSNWNCPVCTFLNNSSRSRCDMCGAKNPNGPQVDEKRKKREEDSDEEEEDDIMWQEDHLAKECNYCGNEFGLLRRRHHCRACGFVFCATCTPFYMSLKKDKAPVRVCIACYSKNGKK